MAERYPNLDFSSIKPNEPEVKGEQEEEVSQGDTMVGEGANEGDQGVVTEGVVEGLAVTMPREVVPGDVIMVDVNPKNIYFLKYCNIFLYERKFLLSPSTCVISIFFEIFFPNASAYRDAFFLCFLHVLK